jgi:hypothetical protein
MPQGPNPEANAISDNPYHRADGQLKVSQPHGGANLHYHPRTGMSARFEDGHSSGNRLQFHCLVNHLQQARSIIVFTKRINGPISRFLSQFYAKLRIVI